MAEVRVVVGGGGVGKTTLVSLLSLNQAIQGKKVLAITFDPSLRLGSLLTEEVQQRYETLDVFLINPTYIFESLLQETGFKVQNLKENKLFQNLLERIVGLQEFTSLYYLNQMRKSKKYDVVYVDTPPFQNALDFFEAPQKLKKLFQSKIFNFFLGAETEGFLGGFLKSSRKLSLKTLKNLTGLDFFVQLLDFLQALETLQPIVLQTLAESEAGFLNHEVTLDYISNYSEASVKQTEGFLERLVHLKLKIDHYYLSKFPGDLSEVINSNQEETLKNMLRTKDKDFRAAETRLLKLKDRYKIHLIRIPHLNFRSLAQEQVAKDWHDITQQT